MRLSACYTVVAAALSGPGRHGARGGAGTEWDGLAQEVTATVKSAIDKELQASLRNPRDQEGSRQEDELETEKQQLSSPSLAQLSASPHTKKQPAMLQISAVHHRIRAGAEARPAAEAAPGAAAEPAGSLLQLGATHHRVHFRLAGRRAGVKDDDDDVVVVPSEQDPMDLGTFGEDVERQVKKAMERGTEPTGKLAPEEPPVEASLDDSWVDAEETKPAPTTAPKPAAAPKPAGPPDAATTDVTAGLEQQAGASAPPADPDTDAALDDLTLVQLPTPGAADEDAEEGVGLDSTVAWGPIPDPERAEGEGGEAEEFDDKATGRAAWDRVEDTDATAMETSTNGSESGSLEIDGHGLALIEIGAVGNPVADAYHTALLQLQAWDGEEPLDEDVDEEDDGDEEEDPAESFVQLLHAAERLRKRS